MSSSFLLPYSRLSEVSKRALDLFLQREIARDHGDEETVGRIEEELKSIRSKRPAEFVIGAEEAYKIIGYVERFTKPTVGGVDDEQSNPRRQNRH